jgi:hypothetical protein
LAPGGEVVWPPAGIFRGRQRGDSLAACGEVTWPPVGRSRWPLTVVVDECLRVLREYEHRVAQEGVSFLTMRQVAEVLELQLEGLAKLRESLAEMSHPQYMAPVWPVEGGAAVGSDCGRHR